MSMRDRMLAVVRGEELDLVPFAQYDMDSMPPVKEVWDLLGRENVGLMRWLNVHRVETPNCRFEVEEIERDGLRGCIVTMFTPQGVLTQDALYEPVMGTASIRKHFVQKPEDYKTLMAYLRDIVIIEDLSQLNLTIKEFGENGVPHCAIDRTPFQQLWIQWVSLDNLCLHMVDFPELIEECMSIMGRNLRKMFEIVRSAPVPYVVIPDNITAPVIGENYFRKFCLPYYMELADMLSDRDIPVYVHLDGDLRPLWTAIGESKIRGIDSFSPPPDNDTDVEVASKMWPDMRLSVNYPSSVHLASPDMIYDTAMNLLEKAGHTGRLQIQISENVPPNVWKKSYPEIIRAIKDFGKP